MAVFRHPGRAALQPVTDDAFRGFVAAWTDGHERDVTPDTSAKWVSLFAIGGGLVAGSVFTCWRHPEAFRPTPGVGVFAVFYIVAQAIERLQELCAPWLGMTEGKHQPHVRAERDRAVMAALLARPDDASLPREAAQAQRRVDQVRANLTLLMWATASGLAMAASGYFGLYLLEAVGVNEPGVVLDIAITGLAIGAGTKPLHDLISNLKEAKEDRQDPPETA